MSRLRAVGLLVAAAVAVVGCGGGGKQRPNIAGDAPSIAFAALTRSASDSAELALARMSACAADGYSATCLHDALGDTPSYSDQVLADLDDLEPGLPRACADQLEDKRRAVRASEDLLVAVVVAADQRPRRATTRALNAARQRLPVEVRPLQGARCP